MADDRTEAAARPLSSDDLCACGHRRHVHIAHEAACLLACSCALFLAAAGAVTATQEAPESPRGGMK